jgi:hypothetical protein
MLVMMSEQNGGDSDENVNFQTSKFSFLSVILTFDSLRGYLHDIFSWLSSVTPEKFCDNSLNLATISVSRVIKLRPGRQGLDSHQGQGLFSFRHRVFGPPSLLSTGYHGLFPGGITVGA